MKCAALVHYVGSWQSATLCGEMFSVLSYNVTQMNSANIIIFIIIIISIIIIIIIIIIVSIISSKNFYINNNINCKITAINTHLVIRFATSLVFWGLSLNAGSFGDVYLNTFLSGLIEIPANILCIVFMKYLGRRVTNAWSLVIGGIFCLFIIPVLLVDPGEIYLSEFSQTEIS